jgi:Cu2+-containing amine oxidase
MLTLSPFGILEHPHQRKHAFDLGEYGGGYMTNSLSLGCDCKGAIAYMVSSNGLKGTFYQTWLNREWPVLLLS